MSAPPSGTVTFLFTDLEGSTRLWERHPKAMGPALARHDALLRGAIERHGGHVFKTVGDAFCAAFATAPDAVTAALAAQRALAAEGWGDLGPLRARMALHTGAADERDGDYFGPPLNRVARVLAAGYGGQVLLTDVVRRAVVGALPPEVGLKDLGHHRLRDLLEPETIAQLVVVGLPDHFPPLQSLERHPTNLPVQPTPLVGRTEELAAVRARLQAEDGRLVTLTGSGGAGKTRLAVQAAADLLDAFEDGAFLVDLAPLTEADLVLPAVAATLGVREGGGRSLEESLVAYLVDRRLLLVLDNFEQVVDAAPRVADLLEACPRLTLLVTSREPLRLRAEQQYAVPPLPLPDLGRLPPADDLERVDAVALFVQRARSVAPGFALGPENARSVAEICVRLDGLPLAIELAAARVKRFAPPALLARLGNRLTLLTSGARDAPTRQQNLRATIAWSYDLLPPEEQALFRRLAVFVGGCTLEAAETVAAAISDRPAGDVLAGLGSLLDKSLLREEDADSESPRYLMLETLREYGVEQLAAAGEAAAIQQAHAEHFLVLAEEAEPALAGPEQGAWLARLEAEHDNLRAALGWATGGGDPVGGLRLAGALAGFWRGRGYFAEGRSWLDRALAGSATATSPVRGKALTAAGVIAQFQGDYARAVALHEEGLALLRELGNPHSVAVSLHSLGLVAQEQGDLPRAATLYEESLALDRELGDRRGVAVSLHNLAIVAGEQGDLARAAALFGEGLALKRELGDRRGVAISLQCLGVVARRQGDPAAAAALFGKGLSQFWELGDRLGVAYSLEGLAGEAAAKRLAGAGRLYGAAEALREAIGVPLSPRERAEHDRGVAAARALMDGPAFATAWATGRSWSPEQAVAEALAMAEQVAGSATPG